MKGYLILLILLIIVPVFCGKYVEHFYIEGKPNSIIYHNHKLDKYGNLKLQDDAGEYTFIPYRTSFIRNVGHRGCETSKYWDCVDKHPETKEGYEINKVPEKIQKDCKRYSSDQCYFPEFISHARTEPYYQYFQYV